MSADGVPGPRSGGLSRRRLGCALLVLGIPGCARPYRIGDYVLVEWGDEGRVYPAYVLALKGNGRYRVHFDGYPARFDEDVTLDRIKGLVEGSPPSPPPPAHVRALLGGDKKKGGESLSLSHYKVGDHLRVRFRGSVYRATVLEVLPGERVKIHYDGHEAVWDEVISADRIVVTP